MPFVWSFSDVHDENTFDEACQEISEVFDAEERAAQAALAEAAQVEHRMSLEQSDDEFFQLHRQRNILIQRAPLGSSRELSHVINKIAAFEARGEEWIPPDVENDEDASVRTAGMY